MLAEACGMLAIAALTIFNSCGTFVDDPTPPTNLRSSPNGSVVSKLKNGDRLNVLENRGGWLRISTPASGWVHMSVTHVHCGEEAPGDMQATTRLIDALGTRARTDGRAADTLARYAITADGGPGEVVMGQLGELMRVNPKLAISVFDQLPAKDVRDLMRSAIGLSHDPAASARSFQKAVDAQPSAPSSAIWKKLKAQCEPDLKEYLGC